MKTKPLLWMLVSAGRDSDSGISYFSCFPWSLLRIYADRVVVNGPPSCSCPWSQIDYLDMKNPGVTLMFKAETKTKPLFVWSPFRIKKRVAEVVKANDLPVSIQSYTESQVHDYHGQHHASGHGRPAA